ncbi:MAG: ABC transporter ATP-binding protein [Alphaproteobacteria bacterium]
MAEVRLLNIDKSYGDFLALAQIDLTIKSGDFFTLLGPSGCGKITLLRLIAGFHTQDRGEVRVAGTSIGNLAANKREVGMVFQDYAIFPHLSVFENVAFGLKHRKVAAAEIKTRVGEILEIVQLDGASERMPHQLSGGQQQRVGLARTLVVRPKVLLMDEPLSNLDAKLRVDLRADIRAIQKEFGITTIYVTHDQEEALAISDEICVMHEGRVQQAASPWDIYHLSKNRFVASFVGANNFLPVSWQGSQALVCGGPATVPDVAGSAPARAIAAIRPEQIKVLPAQTASSDEMICLQVTQVHASLTGREICLSTNWRDTCTIDMIAPAHVLQGADFSSGAPLTLGIERQALRFYRDDETGAQIT